MRAGSALAARVVGRALFFAALAFFGEKFATDVDGDDEGDDAEAADEDDGEGVHECVAPLCEVKSSRGATAPSGGRGTGVVR